MQGNLKEFDINYELKKLPDLPGVYIMYDKDDKIIYVGKSVSLKNRVRSYFTTNHKYKKVQAMVEHIHRFEYIIVNNETESLVLEANLIKKNRPKYNINLKDDKQYPYIKITNEKFPKILKVRDIKEDKAQYFGPFPTISDLEKLMELSILIYNIRDCKLNFDKGKFLQRPCMSYYLGRCSAPCTQNIDRENYNNDVKRVIKFLSGDTTEIKEILLNRMKQSSAKEEYELAMKYRDFLSEIDYLFTKQIFNIKKFKEYHLISYAYAENILVVAIFIVNDGLVVDRKHFIVENILDLEVEELFSNVIRQFYISHHNKVKEVYKGEIKIPKSYKKDEEGLYRDKFGKFVSNQQEFYVNFAGKYMIVTHSCGTSCYYRTVEDLSRGVTVKIEGIEKFDNTEANFAVGSSSLTGFAELYTREDSDLLMARYINFESEDCKQEYFVLKTLKNGKKKLKSISKRTPCDTPIK